MTKRALKLPDGGRLDLPIPEGFGSPILALNEASPLLSPSAMQLIAVGLGILAVVMFWRATTLKAT